MTETEPRDLLAALQSQLDKARAELADERARRTAKTSATRVAKRARVPFRTGDRILITARRYPGVEATVTAINSDVDPGEVQALGAWFALTEVTRLPRTRTP